MISKLFKRKPSKSEQSSLESGLYIENSIKVSYSKKRSLTNVVLLLVITLFGLFGSIFSFISIFNVGANYTQLVAFTLLFFGIFSMITLLPDKFMVAMFPLLFMFLYFFYDYLAEFILGFKVVSNCISTGVHDSGVWIKYYPLPNNVDTNAYATLFLIFCIFILTILICLFTIKISSCVIGFAITFPFVECGLYFGLVPNYVAFFMLVCYWIALLSMALSGCKKSTKNKSAGFVRVGNSFYAKSDCNFKISEKIGISSIVMCIVCAMLSSSLVSAFGYERSEKINNLRNNIKDTVTDFSLDSSSYSLSRLGEMLSSNGNHFNGTLGQKDTVKFTGDERLLLQSTIIPSNDIYLKGYVGSTYTGQSWDRLDSKVFKSPIFDAFKDNNIYPQSVPYLQLDKLLNFDMTIKPIRKSKTTLVPYYSNVDSSFSYVNDTTIKSSDTTEYSYNVLDVSLKDIILNRFSELTSFDNTSYRSFVDENYLQVEDSASMQEVLSIFENYLDTQSLDFDSFKSSADLYAKIDYIKNFLCSNYEYTLSPGRTPVNEDFVLHFLNNKKGYCSHFASAGTILCRMLDIPARYVEGYYISKNEISSSDFDGDMYNLSVTDEVAHAWTEIYFDNFGWVCVDFTPGFNGNPTMADFKDMPDAPKEDLPNTQPLDTDTQLMDTQVAPVTETPQDVTTSPEENNQVTTTTNDNSTSHKNTLTKETLKKIKNVIIVILLVALSIWIVILRRNYILNKRNDAISSKDCKKSILESYRYIMLLLKYLGFNLDDTTQYMQFVEKVSSELDYVQNFDVVMDIVLKSELSNLEVSVEEKSTVSEFASNLANTIYEKSSKVDRLIIKYILCLV